MKTGIDIALVSATLQRLLEQSGRTICYECRATGEVSDFSPEGAAAPTGLLPAFLAAGDAIWREAAGKSLNVEIATDQDTVLGFTVRAIHGGTFATIMLAMLEVIEQASESGALRINNLARIWEDAEDRITRASLVATPA
jgi:hypothetical protein